jgi:uncharacterized membrane protein YraQ (UPF0718 family)
MKRVLKTTKAAFPWALVALVVALWAYDRFVAPFAFGREAGAGLWSFALEMAAFLPAMFVLVGLFDVWVPRRVVERHVGRGSGPLAILWMVLLGTLQAGPLYGAFPVAVALWRKGTAPRNVFIYLGAFCAIKIPLITFEVGFLGWQFSLVRTAVTLPVFIFLAYMLEWLLPADVTIPEPEATLAGTPKRQSLTSSKGTADSLPPLRPASDREPLPHAASTKRSSHLRAE